jgi:hypothetical protein
VGFKLTVSAGERPQTYALDRAATGISLRALDKINNFLLLLLLLVEIEPKA